jgi:hypothetical protein
MQSQFSNKLESPSIGACFKMIPNKYQSGDQIGYIVGGPGDRIGYIVGGPKLSKPHIWAQKKSKS